MRTKIRGRKMREMEDEREGRLERGKIRGRKDERERREKMRGREDEREEGREVKEDKREGR